MQTPGQIQNTQFDDAEPLFRSGRGPIVLVGATVRAAAESARMAGFCPIAVDRYGDRETIAASTCWHPLDEFLKPGGSRKFDAVVPTATQIAIVGGLCAGYRWMDQQRHRFLGADPSLFSECDRPDFLSDLAERAAVQYPQTRWSGPSQRGWLIKHRPSSGGLGVSYSEGTGTIPEDASLQSPVRGPVCGATFFGLRGHAILLGVCRLLKKRIGPHPFVFAGALGPVALDHTVLASLRRLGMSFAQSSEIYGPFNIDVVVHRDSVTLLEVNPRYSGSMEIVERAWGETLMEPCSMFDDAAQWMRRAEKVLDFQSCGFPASASYLKRVVFAQSDRTVSPTDFDRQETGGRWIWKDVPNQTTTIKRHEPLATIVAKLGAMSLREAFRVMG